MTTTVKKSGSTSLIDEEAWHTILRTMTVFQNMAIVLGVLLFAWAAVESNYHDIAVTQKDGDSWGYEVHCMAPETLTRNDLPTGFDLVTTRADDQTSTVARISMGFVIAGVVFWIGATAPTKHASSMFYWLQVGMMFIGIIFLGISFFLAGNVLMSHQCVTPEEQNGNENASISYDYIVGSLSTFVVALILRFGTKLTRAMGMSSDPGKNASTLARTANNKKLTGSEVVQRSFYRIITQMILPVVALIFSIWLLASWNDDFRVKYPAGPANESLTFSPTPAGTAAPITHGIRWESSALAYTEFCGNKLGNNVNTYDYMIPNMALATVVLSAVLLAVQVLVLFMSAWNATHDVPKGYISSKTVHSLSSWLWLGVALTTVFFYFTLALANHTYSTCPQLDLGNNKTRAFTTTASFFGGFFVIAILVGSNAMFIDMLERRRNFDNGGLLEA